MPGEPDDGQMNEMTLLSAHRIRNSSPGGPSTSTLPLGQGGSQQYWICTSERGRNILFFSNLNVRARDETRDLRLSKQAAWTTTPDYPQLCGKRVWSAKLSFNNTQSEIQSM